VRREVGDADILRSAVDRADRPVASAGMKVDLTVLAIPGFIGAMAAEYAWQRRHPAAPGERRAGDYELRDTVASLTMGVGSLAAPYVSRRLLDPLTPGVGRGAKLLIGGAVLASAATTALDVIRRRRAEGPLPAAGVVRDEDRPGRSGPADRLTAGMALAAVGATSLAAATTWTTMTSGKRLFEHGRRDLGGGAGAVALAVLGWDAIYYWNHRLSHESRWLWAVHVVHHSSERYNLSTALRQPVAEGVTMAVPYGLLAWLGVRPSLIEQARALNLIYQFWIHTEVVRSIGWLEKVLNTPSHHRVHHGSNSQYLDRNHGSILIIWDRIFGTFEPEREPAVYGLTTNIASFSPLVIAGHEWRDMAHDVARSRTWSDRLGFVLRGPGWASDRRRELGATGLAA
jgi:sterol desaturase/sphingolipid hydroxylase (fatty acid hydroxylase superfamily)